MSELYVNKITQGSYNLRIYLKLYLKKNNNSLLNGLNKVYNSENCSEIQTSHEMRCEIQ